MNWTKAVFMQGRNGYELAKEGQYWKESRAYSYSDERLKVYPVHRPNSRKAITTRPFSSRSPVHLDSN